jgi:hypothetical protein
MAQRYADERLTRQPEHYDPGGFTKSSTRSEPAVYVAASLLVAASLIHLWVMPEHFRGWWGYGVFFIVVALAQGLFAVALLRWPSQQLCFAGVWVSLFTVVLYVATRAYGTPMGAHAGEVKGAGMLDLSATAAELGVIVALATLLGGIYRRVAMNALLLAGVAIWVWNSKEALY